MTKPQMESRILNLFAYEHELTFTQIKEKLKIRSNLLSYWIKELVKKQIINKLNNKYSLAESAEHLVPYLSENKSTLPVVLVQIGNEKLCFLYKRVKRPYKNLLSLPGGRILIGESLENAAKRIMKNKFNIDISNIKLKSLALEHVKKNKKVIYSFLLILVKAKSKNPIELINLIKNKKNIIKSDYHLINSQSSNIKINTVYSKYK